MNRRYASIVLLLIGLLGFIPLPQTVLATAEISPVDPEVVTTTMDGFIKRIAVKPNDKVNKGDVLFVLDDIMIANKLEKAEQALKSSEQRYMKAYRNAFHDTEAKNNIIDLKNEVHLAKLDKAHYQSMLSRTVIRANQAGIVLYSSPNDFLGKPIKVGERVMLLASPQKKKVSFWLPIDNVVSINKAKSLVLYPNLQPLNSIACQLNYINPIAESMPDGALGYSGTASLDSEQVKLGEKGTLKLYGKAKPIWVLLLQRPIRFLRQSLGI